MSRQEEDTKAEISPMMTEQGREELYLYSLRKMAEERADSDRAALTGLYGPKSFFFKANECMQQHEKLQYALIRMIYTALKRSMNSAAGSRVINCFST